MKKFTLFVLTLSILSTLPSSSQGLLKKVKNAVANELLGTGENTGSDVSKPGAEPSCASGQAVVIIDLSAYQLNYNEVSVSMASDGRILVRDRYTSKYYIIQDGKTLGPYTEADPALTGFDAEDSSGNDEEENQKAILGKYRQYISKSGDKYLITFNGKKYGPYALISQFAVSLSKDKFAAVVTENVATTASQGEQMEKMMENAKSDQERMELAMKFSQQMNQNIMKAGGTDGIMPKFVSNVEGTTYNPMIGGGTLSGEIKYDDVLSVSMYNINDLKGNTLVTLKENEVSAEKIFINSDNTKYAFYKFGTLSFSDKTQLSELFSPHFLNQNGSINIAYLYYSPGKNAIMRHSVPF